MGSWNHLDFEIGTTSTLCGVVSEPPGSESGAGTSEILNLEPSESVSDAITIWF